MGVEGEGALAVGLDGEGTQDPVLRQIYSSVWPGVCTKKKKVH